MIVDARKFISSAGSLAETFRASIGLMFFLLYASQVGVNAQSCTETPRQPLVYESFGSGGQRPLAAGLSSYEYQTGTCPKDGQYIVSDVVDGTCFDSVWHPIMEDHTPGDVRGDMLLINGWYEESAFYNQPVSGLCAGATYEFSFWGINIINPVKINDGLLPILTATVETGTGALVQTIDFGSIPLTAQPTWTRFSGAFTVPDTVTRLTVHLISGKGGSGNDFAIDDIRISQCSTCAPALLYVPDAFSPNKDGVNDELTVFLREPLAFDLKIFNRWGNLIFTSNTPTSKWDGTYAGNLCPPDDYTWIIRYEPVQKTDSATRYVKTGHVLLVR